MGNGSFDDVAKNATVAQLLVERATIAPAITEFWNGTGADFTPARARAQAAKWGVWLVGNGNLGTAWTGYSAAEQADLLAIGAEAVARTPSPAPEPEPDPRDALLEQLLEQTMRLEALAEQVAEQSRQIVALQSQRLIAETTIRIER